MRSLLAIGGLLVIVNALGFSSPPPRYLPGVLVSSPPQQVTSTERPFKIHDYLVTPLANYKIAGRVIARNSYWFGREAEVSPLDIGLAWGRMSDQKVVDQLEFNLSMRFLRWSASDPPAPREIIDMHISNNHLIAASRAIESQLEKISVGQLVELQGKLVKVESADGWSWISSLKRSDSGAGACELFYVESVKPIRAPDRLVQG